MLTAPVPELTYDAVSPSVAAAEQPVTVSVGAVLDGLQPLTPLELRRFAVITYRQLVPGAAEEVWDPQGRSWVEEGKDVDAAPLAFLPRSPAPWQTTLVAAAGKTFTPGIGGYPSYSFRGLF